MTESREPRPELIVALVCPLGTNIDALERSICEELEEFGYSTERVWVSNLLQNLAFWHPEPDQSVATRIAHRQNMAFEFRRMGGPEVLVRAAIAEIRRLRRKTTGDPDVPADAHAYLLRQLKHPSEIALLRRVYGQSVVVVAGSAPEKVRTETLAAQLGEHSSDAERLVHVDEREEHPDPEQARLGQNTRDAYPLSDFFVDMASGTGDSVRRFFRLLFGHPFITPTPEEVAMNQANAMALRSSDERRQVGAVIVRRTPRTSGHIQDADVIASGMNEVPRRGGGSYWYEESPDGRDQEVRYLNQGVDLEDRIKQGILLEVAMRLKGGGWTAPDSIEYGDDNLLGNRLLTLLEGTQFDAISEFMRQVHAEMFAIVDAARRGVSVQDTEMYVTTFPCHNCAKHIIAAGIRKVVYLEPYAKSRAQTLNRHEMSIDPEKPEHAGDAVLFVRFSGVAPRQFSHVFSMASRGRKNAFGRLDWEERRKELSPKYVISNAAQAYVLSERQALEALPEDYKWDRVVLCP